MHGLTLPEVRETLNALAEVLGSGRALWDFRPFDRLDNPWLAGYPSLWRLLDGLPDNSIDALDLDQALLCDTLWPALCADLASNGRALWDKSLFLWQLPRHALANDALDALPNHDISRFSAGIKGRKWQQISRFANIVSLRPSPYPYLEWCAGKGHLGRLMGALTSRPVLSLEWQQALCIEGEKEAQKQRINQRFLCKDAFADDANVLEKDMHALALHACGGLHLTLLRHGVKAGTRAISISPCCYHLLNESDTDWLSGSAKETGLKLDRHALALPLNHALVASDKDNALRHREISWRLGFDALQRTLRGADDYLPLPTLRQSQLAGSFDDFCRWAAEYRELKLPDDFDAAHWLSLGLGRQRLTRRLDLAAHLFRPMIERFLLLDRAAFLLEAGYSVSLYAFCDSNVTPRNALIDARR
ncbi:class I SAM-dependent methyltransferase [Shewanella jiangmenensis]|uniref:class I SAM-dependent methyltransferase n=1 Tax=Shewanella jiangmenensis TaxID=2837387 RepID=UPI0032D8F974